ncbi:MAG: hypothetical protein JWM47_4597 [Acidimicrobiales bacterium]|nr:hypothetical protein [Acidimicrobiales bacterium]
MDYNWGGVEKAAGGSAMASRGKGVGATNLMNYNLYSSAGPSIACCVIKVSSYILCIAMCNESQLLDALQA